MRSLRANHTFTSTVAVQLSDVAKVRVQTGQLYNHEEDMFERSRVTRRLSKVESELEMTVQQLEDLQRSREVRPTNRPSHSSEFTIVMLFCIITEANG